MNIKDELDVFKRITFIEKTHRYYIDEEISANVSVTGAIGKLKPKFDEDMWSARKAKSLGITQDEMKFIWRESNIFSTTLGTFFHSIAESHYTKMPCVLSTEGAKEELGDKTYQELKPLLKILVRQFDAFYKHTQSFLEPVSNELVVGDLDDTRVCGTLDLLTYNKNTKSYEIYDFKTNKNISFKSDYNQTFLSPLDHIPLCEFNTYSFQLSVYKYILEKYTNIRISAMYIVWFRRDKVSYELIKVTDFTEYAHSILSAAKSNVYVS
jgi:hypothetical protein